MEKIVDKFLKELNEQLVVKKVSVTITPAVRTWLAKAGYDPNYGARPLDRVIQKEIKDHLSDDILFGRLNKGGEVVIDLQDEKLTFNPKN
jgi:ATP-dependent Clp protease ATP-binding subunit ClpA